jgi:hypothetical protein
VPDQGQIADLCCFAGHQILPSLKVAYPSWIPQAGCKAPFLLSVFPRNLNRFFKFPIPLRISVSECFILTFSLKIIQGIGPPCPRRGDDPGIYRIKV